VLNQFPTFFFVHAHIHLVFHTCTLLLQKKLQIKFQFYFVLLFWVYDGYLTSKNITNYQFSTHL
jgi:hypothetical protein